MILIKMEPSRKKPKKGDVFVIQPVKDIYFFGVVIKTNIVNPEDGFINGWNLIFIYNCPSKSIEIPNDLMKNELLNPPDIVNNQGWLKGYFKTIGNISINEDDIIKDYGFQFLEKELYFTEEGKRLKRRPKICGSYGLGSYGSVSTETKKALENHPEILEGIGYEGDIILDRDIDLLEKDEIFTGENLIKVKKVLDTYSNNLKKLGDNPSQKDIMKCVEKVVKDFNKLDEEEDYFIETMEREELCDSIHKLAKLTGLEIDEDITEEWREW
ncbi:hypothetical protein CLPU_9c00820 [Gottschalkia purinilytica]|uniref:Immunity protein 26 n=2 Tax=Gottschalkia purinilytica TaxID=1503 RepID=A0A0L0W9R3_GOTPU|nr:hypothetical protein CLPU_9c00820 [Gottschalkia purinilytica]